MEDFLCGTTISKRQLQILLSKILKNGAELVELHGKILGELGGTSTMLEVHLTWSNGYNGLPKSVIIKAMGKDGMGNLFDQSLRDQVEKMRQQVRLAHNNECMIYSLEGLNDHVPMPICYGFELADEINHGMIILEDMRSRATHLPNDQVWGGGMNTAQVESLLQALTSLHAWSLNTTVDWKNRLPPLGKGPSLAPFAETMRMALPQGKKEHPQLFTNFPESKVDQILTKENFAAIFESDPWPRYGLPMVLIHGDIQPLNMLQDKDPDGNAGKLAALLDWQFSRPGCGLVDLSALLMHCISFQTRRIMGDKILQRYVELFNEKVQNKDHRISLDTAKRALDEMMNIAGLMFGCGVTFMTAIVEKMQGMSSEQKERAKKDMVDRTEALLQDALKNLDK